MTTYTLEEWTAKGIELFGEDRLRWKFVCPVCAHVTLVQDWKDAGAPVEAAAFSCVGRWSTPNPVVAFGNTGPNGIRGKGPCNYAGGGLFGLNPITVTHADGHSTQTFAFAEEIL
jgi:hypothetical protein